jgi:hypothetical protein
MAAQLDVTWVPSATDIALAGVSAFARPATRKSGYRAGTYQPHAEALALAPQANARWKISTTTTSPGAAS